MFFKLAFLIVGHSLLGECKEVIRTLHTEVYYANVGAQANPQAKIIGVNHIFSTPEDIRFKCNGISCRLSNSTLPIEISASIGFIDVTQPALEHFAEKPVLEAKLPHDFFYPFVKSEKISMGNPLKSSKMLMSLMLILHFTLILILKSNFSSPTCSILL
jgi:hypothetical protein